MRKLDLFTLKAFEVYRFLSENHIKYDTMSIMVTDCFRQYKQEFTKECLETIAIGTVDFLQNEIEKMIILFAGSEESLNINFSVKINLPNTITKFNFDVDES